MENIQLSTGLFVYICSRNPIAIWAIENLLTPDSSDFHFSAWSPKQPIVVPEGSHILLIDVCSISEWPEAVRKWTDAGHRTILLVADIWDSEGAELRALHLGVRGIVHVSRVTVRELSEAIGFIARGQLVADAETLDEFYGGTRRLK